MLTRDSSLAAAESPTTKIRMQKKSMYVLGWMRSLRIKWPDRSSKRLLAFPFSRLHPIPFPRQFPQPVFCDRYKELSPENTGKKIR